MVPQLTASAVSSARRGCRLPRACTYRTASLAVALARVMVTTAATAASSDGKNLALRQSLHYVCPAFDSREWGWFDINDNGASALPTMTSLLHACRHLPMIYRPRIPWPYGYTPLSYTLCSRTCICPPWIRIYRASIPRPMI